jgi:hypothetical protein
MIDEHFLERTTSMNQQEVQNIFNHSSQVAVSLGTQPFVPVAERTDLLTRLHECQTSVIELELATQKFHIKQKEIQLIESLMRIDFVRDDFRLKGAVKNAMLSALQFWQEQSPPPPPGS